MGVIVNDFNIMVGTVNGSGSQSANLVLMRSIFNMGVPIAGKNIFPSNIAGLPTWFNIRASEHGYMCRRAGTEILVAMNPATAADDVAQMAPGTLVLLNDTIGLLKEHADLRLLKVPFTKLVAEISPEMKLRKLLVNMIYVGIVAQYLGIDTEAIDLAIDKQFAGKKKAADLNKAAVRVGQRWATENPVENLGYRVERREKTKGKIIIDGNAAGALGAVFGGLQVLAWYPITPSSSVCESAITYLERFRHDKNGKATYAVVQCEDELASAGVVIGAGWAGARSMTATAGPGISLMAEFVGLAYYTEIPAVIWDVQRVGPSTGLPTRTAQGDVAFTYNLSHGDTAHIVLLPATVRDCYDFGAEALDLAEEFQTPVFVLSDLDLGMNNWMSDPFPYHDKPLRRGKVLSKEKLDQIKEFARYRDVDGDGIPYRTLPGTDHAKAAYFTRGSGHNDKAEYSEKPHDYKAIVDRLKKKHETARSRVPQPVVVTEPGASIGIIAYGTTHHAIVEGRDLLKKAGIKTDYMQIRALPLCEDVLRFIENHERVYVVEQNRDGQMHELIRSYGRSLADDKLRSVRHYDGTPIDAKSCVDGILAGEKVEVN